MEQGPPFTHVVVGGGSAGCIVAARIAENPSFNVLLIEAGRDLSPTKNGVLHGVHDSRRVPMRGQAQAFDESIDWNVRVELPGEQSTHVAQAKIMGGGSSINGGTALRSNARDSEEWVDLGNPTWHFDALQCEYAKLETEHPITCTKREDAGDIQKSFVDAAEQAGLRWTHDLNAVGDEGVGPSPVCRVGNERISAVRTFIDPVRSRRNVSMLANTLVGRVLFNGYRATGVSLSTGQQIQAESEVILCAGAIFSPAILQRSGIGPKALLDSLQVHCIIDLPVGEGLSDHPTIPVVARPRPGAYKEGDYSLQMQARWSSAQHPDANDLQMICFSYLYAQPTASSAQQRSLGGTTGGHVAGIGCNVNKPSSTGSVQIQSIDPTVQPRVNPMYLSTQVDRSCARECVRQAYSLIVSESMQAVLGCPLGLDSRIVSEDSLLDDWIMANFSSTYHFCGSCRMASRSRGGVVDQNGLVYGLQGLRVCDASILPTIPSCNTMWPTMAFASKIGASIRNASEVSNTC